MQTILRPSRPTAPTPPRRWRRRFVRFVVLPVAVVILLTLAAVLPWRWLAPPSSAFMMRERLLGDGTVAYTWVDWEDISPQLGIAAIAAEDQTFPDHFGFDWDAIRNAMDRNQDGDRLRGGSTISQQVAKNLYLWPNQSWIRKGAEAYLTVWIEMLWPKRRILEVYLNVAEFGPGIYGVGEASVRLRGQSPATLGSTDAATLAAVLPSPRRLSAGQPSEYVRTRASEIQRQVAGLGGPAYLENLD